MQGEVAAARCHPRMKRVVGGGMCRDGRNRAGRTEKSEISLALHWGWRFLWALVVACITIAIASRDTERRKKSLAGRPS
jgi:hypothetical protein